MDLLDKVHHYPIPLPWGDHESMLEYDRRRLVKESLLERIIITCVETANTDRLLRSAVSATHATATSPAEGVDQADNSAYSRGRTAGGAAVCRHLAQRERIRPELVAHGWPF